MKGVAIYVSLTLLIVIYLLIEVVNTHLYFKQSAVIDIEKEVGTDISSHVLPPIFNVYYAMSIGAKIFALGLMCCIGHWIIAIAVGIGLFVVTVFLPVPRYYYDDIYTELSR